MVPPDSKAATLYCAIFSILKMKKIQNLFINLIMGKIIKERKKNNLIKKRRKNIDFL